MIKLPFRNQRDRQPILSADDLENSGLTDRFIRNFGHFEDGDVAHIKLVKPEQGIVAEVDMILQDDGNFKAVDGWNHFLFELPRNPSPVEFDVCSVLINDQEEEETVISADEEDDWSDDEQEVAEDKDDWSDDSDEETDEADDFEDEEPAAPAPAARQPRLVVTTAKAAPAPVVEAKPARKKFEYLGYQELMYVINKNDGNKTAAARELGCSIDTLRRMLKKAEAARPKKKAAQSAKTKAKSKSTPAPASKAAAASKGSNKKGKR